jgi:HEPN domain-containing protein
MKSLTKEWVAKAEGDYQTARRELSAPDAPNYDAVCFHAQQCAEKYLKARMIEAEISFPKVHDLDAILNLVLPLEPGWDFLRNDLSILTDKAVEVRYPGYSTDAEEAAMAMHVADRVRQTVRESFKLPL